MLQSFLAMLVFGTALTLVTAVFSLTGRLGWLPVTGLAIAVLIVGFRLRRLLDNLTTMMRPGAGSIMLGGLARRGAMGAVQTTRGCARQSECRTAHLRSAPRNACDQPKQLLSGCRQFVFTGRRLRLVRWVAGVRAVRRMSSLQGLSGGEPRAPGPRVALGLVASTRLVKPAVFGRPERPVRRRVRLR